MRSRNRKVKKQGSRLGSVGNYAGRASCIGLLAIGVMALNPMVGSAANALAAEEPEGGALTSSVSISFAPASGNTTLSPSGAAGASGLISVLANVGVANSGGYSVYLGSSSANLVGRNNNSVVIPGVAGEVNFDNLQDNTWGYYAGEGSSIPESATYKAVSQGQGGAIFTNNNSRVKNENKTFVLGFAAKIDNSIPADVYENQVTLSVVSSPYQLTLMDLDDMQEMTSTICENTGQLATKQLRDARDGKYYWVSRLADGRCWMTQNLDLDLSTTRALTSEDSDVAADWVPDFSTSTEVTAETILADNLGQRSWSLGDYRLVDPTVSNDCGYSKNDASQCPEQFTAYSTPTTANRDEQAHYILGNHYQWNAATAGTGGTITSGQAEGSICPKGWGLPTSNSSVSGSFGGLINAGLIGTDVVKLTSSPYYFVRGGDVHQSTDGRYFGAGDYLYYWSSTSDSVDINAYNLYASGVDLIGSSNAEYRQFGFSVRCIVR